MSGQVFHGPLIRGNKDFRIVSVLERNKSLSVEKFPEAVIVRSFDKLLANDEISLVIVNTPDVFHYVMCRDALLSGRHVVAEKPFVKDSAQGEELIKIAREKGLMLSVFQNRRWDGDFLTVRKIIDEGILGRLVEYEAHFDRYRKIIPRGTWKEEAGTGSTLYNLGSHLIDQALVLFGKPEYVYADIRTLRDAGSIDDAFTLMLGYTGTKVTLKASYLVREPGPRYYLHGTDGSYLKYGIDPQEDDLKAGGIPGSRDWGEEDEKNWGILNTGLTGKEYNGKYRTLAGDYPEYYRGIASALRNGSAPPVTATEANLVIRVIEAAMESSREGRRIRL